MWCLTWKVLIRKTDMSLWLCNMKKKMTTILKIKKGKSRRGQTNFGARKGTFHWWICNCCKVWWSCVASFSLQPFKCDQAGTQADENSTLGDFFKSSLFGVWLLFSCFNTTFGFGSAKTIPWTCFSSCKIFTGCF